MIGRQKVPSFAVSLAMHVGVLTVLHFLITFDPNTFDQLLPIETVIEDPEQQRLDFEQKLTTEETPAKTLNQFAGAPSTDVGGASRVVAAREKIEVESNLPQFDAPFLPSDVTTPGAEVFNADLGDEGIHGSTQMLVRGYGEALDQLTWELLRLMRKDKLLVVWLFDESGSMKDDQEDIKKRIGKVFTELKIVDREPEKTIKRKRKTQGSLLKELMLTTIASFGATYTQHTKAPTADFKTIVNAIGHIPVDKSGKENTCSALIKAIARHKSLRARTKRRLVLIVISDESGDDGKAVERVVEQARIVKSPIYVLGRESVFGSLYAHVRWKQPITGKMFYLPIRRGPETPFPELLQHDGYRRRYDSHMSGFGPYVQVRLCRETNGVFFQLPHEQQDLNDFDDLKYAALALQEYRPNRDSPAQYSLQRDRSKFRRAIWEVIVKLNPYRNKGLEIPRPDGTFSTDPREIARALQQRGKQVLAMIAAFEWAIRRLEGVRSLRENEPSRRWRANYDLIRAQLRWYQLRLFEYGIGLDQFARRDLRTLLAKHPRHNRWYVRETGRKLVLPDPANQKRFKITPEQLRQKHREALEEFARVAKLHDGTPWASRAKWEARRPFGLKFGSYESKPGKPGKRRPKPPPPPQL